MADANALATLVGTVGFPIVSFFAMFWLVTDIRKKDGEKTDKLTETINNNTIALTKLSTKLGGE